MSGSHHKRIFVVDDDMKILESIRKNLEKERYFVYSSDNGNKALDIIYNEPPDLIILDLIMPEISGEKLCNELKNDSLYGHLPIIMLIPKKEMQNNFDIKSLKIDDYIVKPFSPEELKARTSLCLARSNRELDANPLTRLPGNHSIIKETQYRLDNNQIFSFAYLDIDNFKSFNDKYGFSRGDEVLRMTARLLTSIIRSYNSPECYVGHIGGDDFVFIVPPQFIDEACTQMIKNFELIIPTFYDEEDRIRGQIKSTDRQGKIQYFPIMTFSIAVVSNEKKKIKHAGEISDIASKLKKHAKTLEGSNYVTDRRK